MSELTHPTTDQHTSGPWTPDDRDSADQYRYVLDNGGGTICRIRRGFHRPIEEDEANARLIAAAPELLAALKRLLGTTYPGTEKHHETGCRCVIHEAQMAIAKAEGRDHV